MLELDLVDRARSGTRTGRRSTFGLVILTIVRYSSIMKNRDTTGRCILPLSCGCPQVRGSGNIVQTRSVVVRALGRYSIVVHAWQVLSDVIAAVAGETAW
jgi:hypothetical protein